MIRRRDFVFGTVSVVAALGRPRRSLAALSCGPYDSQGVMVCTVGLAVPLETARQQASEWCWAACVSAVFAFHGRSVSQERIAQRLFGVAVNAPADGYQIAATITGSWQTEDGPPFDAEAEVLWNSQAFFNDLDARAQAAAALENGDPLIVGALGHATVLTAMTYDIDVNGRYQIIDLTVRDPWPGNPNRRSLTQQEVLQTSFLTKVAVH